MPASSVVAVSCDEIPTLPSGSRRKVRPGSVCRFELPDSLPRRLLLPTGSAPNLTHMGDVSRDVFSLLVVESEGSGNLHLLVSDNIVAASLDFKFQIVDANSRAKVAWEWDVARMHLLV